MERHIQERFPDRKQSIEQLMAEDTEFLALCEDYDVCINALRYWARSRDPEAEIRINEYRTIARQLEEEVIESLIALKLRTDCGDS